MKIPSLGHRDFENKESVEPSDSWISFFKYEEYAPNMYFFGWRSETYKLKMYKSEH